MVVKARPFTLREQLKWISKYRVVGRQFGPRWEKEKLGGWKELHNENGNNFCTSNYQSSKSALISDAISTKQRKGVLAEEDFPFLDISPFFSPEICVLS
jgi:hypothetical protein